jgi:hypothetical protein
MLTNTGSGSSCWIDVIWMMTPDLCSIMVGNNARSMRTAGMRFRFSYFAHSASSNAAKPPPGAVEPPRTLTMMSTAKLLTHRLRDVGNNIVHVLRAGIGHGAGRGNEPDASVTQGFRPRPRRRP